MKNWQKYTLYAIVGLFLVVFAITNEAPQKKIEKPESKQSKESYISGWDGSHRPLTEKLKENIPFPKTYEHIRTNFMVNQDGKTLTVTQSFKYVEQGLLKRAVAIAETDRDTGEILSLKINSSN